MHVHYHPLARNVFLSEHLGEVVKSSLAKSLLWSVLFKGAGTWGHIGTCWIKKLEAARVYVLRAMYGNFRGAGDGVMTTAPEELRRLADENCNDPDTWHGLSAQDLEQMALIMHQDLGAMPPYSCKPEEWHKLWGGFSGSLEAAGQKICSTVAGDLLVFARR